MKHYFVLIIFLSLGCTNNNLFIPTDTTNETNETNEANKKSPIPTLFFEYSYALDLICPERVEPEYLSDELQALITNIPLYQEELLTRVEEFQNYWENTGTDLLRQAVKVVGKPFARSEFSVALVLCARLPSVGTPLTINMISYLHSSAKDIPNLDAPLDPFFFASITFHEVLHKYIKQLLTENPSSILQTLDEPELVKAHLHLFALQKRVFESLQMHVVLPSIEAQEATHGPDYQRAWNLVHENALLEQQLIDELRLFSE